jgi:hypothetical protein
LSANTAAENADCGGPRLEPDMSGVSLLSEYMKLGAEAIALIKALYPYLPTQNRDEIEAKIHAAEEALQKANVILAREWNYKICRCTFPPQIMRWDENEQSNICRSCGHRLKSRPEIARSPTTGGSWSGSRRR